MADLPQEMKQTHPFFVKRSQLTNHEEVPLSNSSILLEAANSDYKEFSRLMPATDLGRKEVAAEPTDFDTFEAGSQLLEVDPNFGRRKRQKSSSPEEEYDVDNSKHPSALGCAGSSPVAQPICRQEQPLSKNKTVTHQAPATRHVTEPSSAETDDNLAYSNSLQLMNHKRKEDERPAEPVSKKEEIYTDGAGNRTPPKMLRLYSKAGTLGSPPKVPKSITTENLQSKTRASKSGKPTPLRVVSIIYGQSEISRLEVGKRLDEIMSGIFRQDLPVLSTKATVGNPSLKAPRSTKQGSVEKVVGQKASGKKKLTEQKSGDDRTLERKSSLKKLREKKSNATHPFFLGKLTPKSATPEPDGISISGAHVETKKPTPLKSLKTSTTLKFCSPVKRPKPFRGFSGVMFGQSNKTTKIPGALDPCWPPHDMMNVRGPDFNGRETYSGNSDFASLRVERKSKNARINITDAEDLIERLAVKLEIANVAEQLSYITSDQFPEPSAYLRVPKRIVESGTELQKRVQSQLLQRLRSSVDDGSSGDCLDGEMSTIHPAVRKVYESIATTLTAFDRSTYETQSWTQKYAPTSAAEVLQLSRDAFILKDWLIALTVVAVETGAHDKSRAGSAKPKRLVRKRKRRLQLDGFVVSSDEEENDLDEITEPEDDTSPRGSQSLTKRTAIHGQVGETGKMPNAIVISGPSGCGKSAMVYAVAKELGFEVFEINSSSRRSGKDILEKVGDMMRNHQVQRSNKPASNLVDDETSVASMAFAADLQSGRQGTMNSFFKPKVSASETSSQGVPNPPPSKDKGAVPESKPRPKQQKQSLILLEEVDVLFEEDKVFWSTIMTLISQSKRPIIMTCNDETLVPFQALTLHAIIRLGPPPKDLAIDYMLLVAAAEGHVIHRKAVQTLFKAKKSDLRASLTELDYWCQIGVGDCKGGFDWYVPRWPLGIDVDAEGNTIKVISKNTYQPAMGWLQFDPFMEDESFVDACHDFSFQTWKDWSFDFADFETVSDPNLTLSEYEGYLDSLSAGDICASNELATGHNIRLDVTIPKMYPKHRSDYTLGQELLEVQDLVSFDSTTKSIAFWIASAAQQSIKLNSKLSNGVAEKRLIRGIAKFHAAEDDFISRLDFSDAFDPIAESEMKTPWNKSSGLELSVFDRTTTIIAEDAAPYVRGIVAHDIELQAERIRLSNLLSEGGQKTAKKMRTTRAALSALEGGNRNTTRPERYFPSLNPAHVSRTGMPSWQDAIATTRISIGNNSTRENSHDDDTSARISV